MKEASPDGTYLKKNTVVKSNHHAYHQREYRRRDEPISVSIENAAVLINETNEPIGTRVFRAASP